MEEERKEIEEVDAEEPADDGKIHFPLSGIIIIGTITLLMIVCIIVLKLL